MEEVDEVWFIEAPGKAHQMRSILNGMGLNVKVQATKGHFMKFPDNIKEIGINTELQELDRNPSNPEIIQKIMEACSGIQKAVIATDADREGDVIAYDVYEVIKDIVPFIIRVRLKAIDEGSILDAIAEATPVSKKDAIPGRTRAIIDRVIGSSYAKDGIVAGRVGSAILGLCAKGNISPSELVLIAPSPERNKPWTARTPVVAPLDMTIAEKLKFIDFPVLFPAESKEVVKKPSDMGRIMVRVSDGLDISPKEASDAMQIAYETGKLSYPRSSSRSMTSKAAKKLEKMYKKSGFKFDAELVAQKDEKDAHDSPYPMGDIDITLSPERLGHVDGVRVMIGRELIKSGMKTKVDIAERKDIKDFLISKGFSEEVSSYIAKLKWIREQGVRLPGDTKITKSDILRRRSDAVLLEKCIEAGMGKPSTWANHIDKFFDRGLVDSNLTLTAKGHNFVAGTPDALLDPRVSAAIEKACEVTMGEQVVNGKEPWERLAKNIVSSLPGAMKKTIEAGLETREKQIGREQRNDMQSQKNDMER